jgi:hypothetical protein
VSEFVLTGSDVFGRYCRIEQLRYGVPNEMFLYKVVGSLRSNCWCEVPYKTASKEVRHDSIEDCILAICCGIDETEVLRFRAADVEFVPQPTCDRDALLELADEMTVEKGDIWRWSRRIREACGVER